MKAISKGSLAGCLVHLDAGSTNRLAKNLQIPENVNNRTIPSWLLVLVYLLEIDSPLVALMPFWSPPYRPKIQTANHSSFAPGVTTKTTQQRRTQSPRTIYQHEGDTPC